MRKRQKGRFSLEVLTPEHSTAHSIYHTTPHHTTPHHTTPHHTTPHHTTPHHTTPRHTRALHGTAHHSPLHRTVGKKSGSVGKSSLKPTGGSLERPPPPTPTALGQMGYEAHCL